MPPRRFGLSNLFFRLMLAVVVVFSTFNPLGRSYWHWLVEVQFRPAPLVALVGVVILIGWVILLRATFRSLGIVGLGLAAAFFSAIVWGLVEYELVPRDRADVLIWLGQCVVVGVLTTGVSWSHIRRRIAGQYDVDDVTGG